MAADTCELRATRQKVKASAICFVLPSRLPLELGGEGSADIYIYIQLYIYTYMLHTSIYILVINPKHVSESLRRKGKAGDKG